MFKLGLIAILIIVVLGGATYLAFPIIQKFIPGKSDLAPETQLSPDSPQTESIIDTTSPQSSSTPTPSLLPTPQPNDLLGRIKALEQVVLVLQSQKTPAPAPVPSSTTTIINNAGPTIYYIPIGVGGYTSNTTWGNITEQQITIDTGNFPGYKSARLVVQMRTINALGTGYAILYNTSNNSQISGSQVSNVGSTASPAESGSFQLTQGRNSYILQAQQTGGQELSISFAYLKIFY